MKRMNFNEWCKTAWLKCSLLVTALMLALMLLCRNTWSTPLKCVAAVAALVPVHATEKWLFPGGFAYQYNLFLNKSRCPNAYPMNRASDMITVLGTTVMYALLVLYFAATGSMTVYAGFLVLGCIMARQIAALGISGADIGWCVAVLGVTSVLVFVPEAKFKDEHSPYAYPNSGYYERFLRK